MSAVGSIDLETESIRNHKLFLQPYFAFRNINTSKYVTVFLIHGSRVFPWLWSFFFPHTKELCINLAQNKVDLCCPKTFKQLCASTVLHVPLRFREPKHPLLLLLDFLAWVWHLGEKTESFISLQIRYCWYLVDSNDKYLAGWFPSNTHSTRVCFQSKLDFLFEFLKGFCGYYSPAAEIMCYLSYGCEYLEAFILFGNIKLESLNGAWSVSFCIVF